MWHNNDIDSLTDSRELGKIMDSRTWLEQNFEEVSPHEFYRDLFPEGALDEKDAFTKGKYCAIAVQVTSERKAKRFTICNGLEGLDELLSSDEFTVISPMSYAGKSQRAENQRFCYAIAVDLDNLIVEDGEPVGIKSVLSQTREVPYGDMLISTNPRPTYIAASSANNIHLYYVLQEPIPMFSSNVKSLARYKTHLTERLWNAYVTSDYDKTQQEPIGQGMRAVGSISKDGKSRVRAFKVGEKVSIEYLNRVPYATEETKIELWNSPEPSKKKEPIERKVSLSKPAFYDWYKRNLLNYTKDGKRYFGLMVLAIIGKKCGISREQVEEDALSFVPQLDEKTEKESNHFSDEDALKAITAYDVPHFMFMTRQKLVDLSGVPMQANKRNGRTRQAHMKRVNRIIDLDIEDGEPDVRYHGGAPTKEQMIKEYAANHPEMSNRQIGIALGVSRNTVNKWLKG